MKEETLEEAAEKWLFETNGHKWSNNDDTAGDNYGSFIAGAEWQSKKMYTEKDLRRGIELARETARRDEFLHSDNEIIKSINQSKQQKTNTSEWNGPYAH
jgi:hypothetical protein